MTRYHQDGTLPDYPAIFVFGSNLAGVHGAGAAKAAEDHFGAERGVGEGRTGKAYAIPTKSTLGRVRPLREIEESVDLFLAYALRHPELQFFVTRVGCGLAGFSDEQIAPMFKGAPDNCSLPEQWREWAG